MTEKTVWDIGLIIFSIIFLAGIITRFAIWEWQMTRNEWKRIRKETDAEEEEKTGSEPSTSGVEPQAPGL